MMCAMSLAVIQQGLSEPKWIITTILQCKYNCLSFNCCKLIQWKIPLPQSLSTDVFHNAELCLQHSTHTHTYKAIKMLSWTQLFPPNRINEHGTTLWFIIILCRAPHLKTSTLAPLLLPHSPRCTTAVDVHIKLTMILVCIYRLKFYLKWHKQRIKAGKWMRMRKNAREKRFR